MALTIMMLATGAMTAFAATKTPPSAGYYNSVTTDYVNTVTGLEAPTPAAAGLIATKNRVGGLDVKAAGYTIRIMASTQYINPVLGLIAYNAPSADLKLVNGRLVNTVHAIYHSPITGYYLNPVTGKFGLTKKDAH